MYRCFGTRQDFGQSHLRIACGAAVEWMRRFKGREKSITNERAILDCGAGMAGNPTLRHIINIISSRKSAICKPVTRNNKRKKNYSCPPEREERYENQVPCSIDLDEIAVHSGRRATVDMLPTTSSCDRIQTYGIWSIS